MHFFRVDVKIILSEETSNSIFRNNSHIFRNFFENFIPNQRVLTVLFAFRDIVGVPYAF